MDRLGKYDIRQVLGRGATSTVYLGHDPFSGRDVAIKVAAPEILHDKERGRTYSLQFINEAALAGKLIHPHIVQIFDAVVDADFAYIVMEFVPGGTLERFCETGLLLPYERVVEIIFKCTRALNFAYQLGITHRDIKPANILLAEASRVGDIKISDFGASISGAVDKTIVSGIGTPAYMSPQQVREAALDHRTDIYSLGVVMYQLLTGRLPFEASSHYNMIYQIIHTAPTLPSTLRKDLPPALEDIVLRAMAKELDRRYPTWEEFASDLANAFRQPQGRSRSAEFADSEKFNTLRGLAFFAGFTDVELWEVVRFARWDSVAPGGHVMRDGEHGDFFCFVIDGELKVAKNGRMLNVLSAGECFGEMAVIKRRHKTRGADVVALTDARIISIAGDALQKSSDNCRLHFYESFVDILAARLALSNQRLSAF